MTRPTSLEIKPEAAPGVAKKQKSKRPMVVAVAATISLTAIASGANAGLLPRIPGLSGITDTISNVTSTINSVQSTINSVTSTVNSVTNTVGSVTSTINGATGAIGGVTGAINGVTGAISEGSQELQDLIKKLTAPIQAYIDKIKSQVEEAIGSSTDAIDDVLGGILGDVTGAIDELLGDMGLPDPEKVKDAIAKARTEGNISRTPISMVNPVLQSSVLQSVNSVLTARTDAGFILSEEAQAANKEELERLAEGVSTAVQQGEASNNLSTQASEITTQSGELATQAGTIATQAGTLTSQAAQTATQAQSRVSTQDAIKDLNTLTANVSSQLGGLATQGAIEAGQLTQLSAQSAVQAGQLSNISRQTGTSIQLQSGQLLRQQQMVTGLAAANQNLADLNELAQGQEQDRIIQGNGAANRLSRANSTSYRLAR
jgi:uncharacterized protein YoxC